MTKVTYNESAYIMLAGNMHIDKNKIFRKESRSMLKTFNSTEMISEKEVNKLYPNSMYLMQDVNDPNNVCGVLLAVSTDKESYREICIKRKELVDKGIDCALLGSYNGGAIGVLSRSK